MLFDGVDPSDEEIIKAKKDYWRAYNTDLKRRKRKAYPTFQISFSRQDVTLLKSRLQNGQSISRYIYGLVKEHLKSDAVLEPKVNTAIIEQQLFLISEYLRELLDYDHIDSNRIEQLEAHIQTLDKVIQNAL